ncbi:MAG: hypothetical protein ACT4OM_02990 [Actinomycetota bacterium]
MDLTMHLRTDWQRYPAAGSHPVLNLEDRLREITLRAKEMEAWGMHTFDSCALAAAAEAYFVVATVRRGLEHFGSSR